MEAVVHSPPDALSRIDPDGSWAGSSVFIIGGGASLKGFNFSLLKGKNTIGINDAFRLGSDISRVCLFGDASWFHRVKWDLEKFQGKVASMATSIMNLNLPWMIKLGRSKEGLGVKTAPGWNYSTGAAAICVAFHLGVKQIYLLGFDMGLTANRSHWHAHRSKTTSEDAFRRHLRGIHAIADELKKHPEVKVINVTPGSRITSDIFPWMSFTEFESAL